MSAVMFFKSHWRVQPGLVLLVHDELASFLIGKRVDG